MGWGGGVRKVIPKTLLKSLSATFLLVCFVSLKRALVKQRKMFCYLSSKALFILEIKY